MDCILKTIDLTKKYKNKKVVDGLNICVKKGEIYGFIGKNGAGKTTTIRMLLGLIKPSAGEVELFGEKVKPGKYKHYERIGSIVEVAGFYPNLTAVENLEIHRRMMGILDKKCIEKPLEVVGLWEERNKKINEFSLGMKQRMGIARALLYQPELLILDEPTNGLDPVGIKEIRELMQRLTARSGMTIFVSSHILSEIQQIASTIGIIHQGRLIEEINNEELQKKCRQFVELRVNDDRKAAFVLEQKLGLGKYTIIEPGVIRVYDPVEDPAAFNRALFENMIEIRESIILKDSLEDYFVEITGGIRNA